MMAMSKEAIASLDAYKHTFVNRLYKILCLQEENKDWKKYVRSLHIELKGLQEELYSVNYWALRAKVGELRFLGKEPEDFRATVFECIQLIGGMPNEPDTLS